MFLEPVDHTVLAKLVHLAGAVCYKDIQIKLPFTVPKGHNVMQASQNKLLSKNEISIIRHPSQQLDLVGKSKTAGPSDKALGWEPRIHSGSMAKKLCNLNYGIYILWSSGFSCVKRRCSSI